MSNEFARNIQDASLNPASFTLPAGASTSTVSAAVDLGSDAYKPESIELELEVPELSAIMAPAAATAGVTYIIESSTTSTFAAVARTLVSKTIAGSASGVAATKVRSRVPADCERYIRGKVSFGATTTDASTLAASLKLLS